MGLVRPLLRLEVKRGNDMIHIAPLWNAAALPFCILLLAAVPAACPANQENPVPRLAKSIPPNGNSWEMAPPPSHFGTLLQAMDSEAGAQFERVIRFRQKGEPFVYGSTAPEGSGGFTTEAIFWIAPDGGVHRVDSEQAERACENKVKDGEFLLAGGPEILLFSNGALRFEFLIANKGDPNCCPTAGRMSGTYRITGSGHYDRNSKQYISTFQLVVEKCRRHSLPSADLTDDIRRNR